MSEPIIEYRDEFNVMDFVSKYAERVSRVIDEQTLANVEHQLARYDYVKVVRCSDCEHYRKHKWFEVVVGTPLGTDISDVCMLFADGCKVEPDGFCAWASRRSE